MWEYRAERPETALAHRDEFLAALDGCAGGNVDRFAASLIYSELVGNVVRHAPGPIHLRLTSDGTKAHLCVEDQGQGFVPRGNLPESPWNEGGRGLFLVKYFSNELQVQPVDEDGTRVCVTFPVRSRALAN